LSTLVEPASERFLHQISLIEFEIEIKDGRFELPPLLREQLENETLYEELMTYCEQPLDPENSQSY